MLATSLCGAFWIATAWPSGLAATMMAAVFCSIFATMSVVVDALKAKLAKVTVGNPRNATTRMGSLVSLEQLENVKAGIATLRTEAELVFNGDEGDLVDADRKASACILRS